MTPRDLRRRIQGAKVGGREGPSTAETPSDNGPPAPGFSLPLASEAAAVQLSNPGLQAPEILPTLQEQRQQKTQAEVT